MPFSFVVADSKLKLQKLDPNNYKYIPKDKRIPFHCIRGIIEFSDGGFFCLEKEIKYSFLRNIIDFRDNY